LYPVKHAIATTAFVPAGISLAVMYYKDLLEARAIYG
jgi:hypothetical protein